MSTTVAATREDIDEVIGLFRDFVNHVDKRFDGVDERFDSVDERFNSVDKRFDGIESRLDGVESRLDGVEVRLGSVESRLEAIENNIFELKKSHERLLVTIDSFISRLDRYEVEQRARDHQFEKLLAWARKVSEKTGIPLENL